MNTRFSNKLFAIDFERATLNIKKQMFLRQQLYSSSNINYWNRYIRLTWFYI